MLLQQSINTCQLYTHVTPIFNALVYVIYLRVSGKCTHTIQDYKIDTE